jgi:hypothetical protein
MSLKTYEDCAKCSHLTLCTAHITGGSHPHNKGVDPCVIDKKRKFKCTAGTIRFANGCEIENPTQDRCWLCDYLKEDIKQSTKTAIPPSPPSTMPRKGEEPEPGYAQRFSLRDGK